MEPKDKGIVYQPSETQVAADLGRQAAIANAKPIQAPEIDGLQFVILRDGNKERLVPVEGRMPPPHRKTGTVQLKDVDSFCRYYEMHGNGAPVYATLQPAKFVAVLNDHTKDAAGHRDYRAEFVVAHSREWNIWTKHNGQGAAFGSNEAFALFIEDNSLDIVNPDPSRMLQIALNFRVKADVTFSHVQRLQDGNIALQYQNIVTAQGGSAAGAGDLSIPELFAIEIPVFDGINARKYMVEARFRYRLREGKLTLWYELVRPHKTVELAFSEIWEQIAADTKAPILYGTPE